MILKLVPGTSFANSKTISAFADTDLQLMMKMVTNNNLQKPWPATLLKKRLWHRCFPVNFLKFVRTPFYTEHLCRLLLNLSTHCYLQPRISNRVCQKCDRFEKFINICHSSQDHLKTGDFKKKQEDGSFSLKNRASPLKRESWNICICVHYVSFPTSAPFNNTLTFP